MELLLDTKGSCFLCLTDISTTIKNEVSLRIICRYLNIDPYVILQESSKNNQDEMEEMLLYYSVPLCLSCTSVSSELSELIDQLEKAKMLVNHQIKLFQDTLNYSMDDQQSISIKYQKKTTSNPIEAGLWEKIRKDVKEKCAIKIKGSEEASIPKVQPSLTENIEDDVAGPSKRFKLNVKSLYVNTPKITMETCTQFVNENIEENEEDAELSEEDNEDCAEDELEVSPLPARYNKELLRFRKLLEPHFTRLKDKRTQCLYCDFCNKGITRVHTHLLTIHSEKVLTVYKHPQITEEEFKICSENVFTNITYKGIQEATQMGVKKKDGKNVKACWLCGRSFTIGRSLKFHLISRHLTEVEKSLKESQRTIIRQGTQGRSIPKMKKNSGSVAKTDSNCSSLPVTDHHEDNYSSSSSSGSGDQNQEPGCLVPEYFNSHFKLQPNRNRKCLYCSYSKPYSSTQTYLNYLHLMQKHPEKLYISFKLEQMSKQEFKHCCEQVFLAETRKSEDEASRKGFQSLIIVKREKSVKTMVCWLCEKRCEQGWNFKFHLASKHTEYLEKMLIDFQIKYCEEIVKKIAIKAEGGNLEDEEENVKMEEDEEDSLGIASVSGTCQQDVFNSMDQCSPELDTNNFTVSTSSNECVYNLLLPTADENELMNILPDL